MKLAENGYFGVRESLGNVRRRFIATESFVTLQNFKSKFRLLLSSMRWFSKLLRIIFCCKNYFSLISMRHVELNEDHDFRFATRWTSSWWWCRIDEQLKCLIHCLIDSKLEACLPAASIHHVAAYEKSSAEKVKSEAEIILFFFNYETT